MIHLKNKFEVEKMYVAGQIVKETLFLILRVFMILKELINLLKSYFKHYMVMK